MVAHTYNPTTEGTELGGSGVQSQLGLSKTLFFKNGQITY